MKALSVMQPWAGFIIYCGKPVENRNWKFPLKYRGPLLICSSKRMEPGWNQAEFEEFLADIYARRGEPVPDRFRNMEEFCLLGHAIGVVDVVGCDREYRTWWDVEGQIHIRLANPTALDYPFPVRGELGLFDVDLRAASAHVGQAGCVS